MNTFSSHCAALVPLVFEVIRPRFSNSDAEDPAASRRKVTDWSRLLVVALMFCIFSHDIGALPFLPSLLDLAFMMSRSAACRTPAARLPVDHQVPILSHCTTCFPWLTAQEFTP